MCSGKYIDVCFSLKITFLIVAFSTNVVFSIFFFHLSMSAFFDVRNKFSSMPFCDKTYHLATTLN